MSLPPTPHPPSISSSHSNHHPKSCHLHYLHPPPPPTHTHTNLNLVTPASEVAESLDGHPHMSLQGQSIDCPRVDGFYGGQFFFMLLHQVGQSAHSDCSHYHQSIDWVCGFESCTVLQHVSFSFVLTTTKPVVGCQDHNTDWV